jgi:hydroxymethylbilane synthase
VRLVPAPLRLATRGSALARWQAEHVASLLAASGVDTTLVFVETTGDLRRDVPIAQLGGQGIFVKEVEAAVLDGRADAAVHSAKDLQSTTAPGLVLAAVPSRGDPRDALVGRSLASLETGATVATGSVRRRAQLAWLRPDLTFVGLRGNMDTRLAKVDQPGGPAAVVAAAAALVRLGWQDRIAEYLEPVARSRWSAARRIRRYGRRWPLSKTPRAGAPSTKNAPFSPSSAVAATCRSARSRSWTNAVSSS